MFQITRIQKTSITYLAELLQFAGLDTDISIELHMKIGEVSEQLTERLRVSGQQLVSCLPHGCLNKI